MGTFHFKEISEYMEEFWKTHIIVPPHEDDPPYIVGRVKEIKENLTMEENPIKITIENYCGQNVTFTMSSDAEIESSLCIIDDKVTEVHINAYDKDILIEKEDI
jgi:hypothetical protein